MYRIYDKTAIIKAIQAYLGTVDNSNIYVAVSGVYDDITKLSVLDFQKRNQLAETGTVNKETMELLYDEYIRTIKVKELEKKHTFPLSKGVTSDEIREINKNLTALLDYYGYTHYVNANSNYYSADTADAVRMLRKIYLLDDSESIDEELYCMMNNDLLFLTKTQKY